MTAISTQSAEQRFLMTVGEIGKQITSSKDFRKQLDAIVKGDSSSIKISDMMNGAEKKLRFFSHEFVAQMKDIKKRMQALPETARDEIYEHVLQVLVSQIEKQHVVYREKVDNSDAQYFTSDEILAKVRNGEFTLRTKSGEKKIAIAGTVAAEGEMGKSIKEINITAIGPEVFAKAAKVLNEILLAVEASREAEAVKEAPAPSVATEAPPPPTPKMQQEAPVSTAVEDSMEYAPEEAAMQGYAAGQETAAEEEREFREAEKRRDIAEKEKKKKLEAEEIAKQELKREAANKDVVKQEVASEEIVAVEQPTPPEVIEEPAAPPAPTSSKAESETVT